LEKGLLTIHFQKIEFGRRARRASEGFSWKPISVLGFGSETICPSREIGEVILTSHLQVLALWFEDLHCGKKFICRFEGVRAISPGTSEEFGHFSLSWVCPPMPGSVLSFVGGICIIQSRVSIAGRDLHADNFC